MGRKTFKEHFGIEHIVQVRDWNILIWSPYISDLIVVSKEWVMKKFERSNVRLNSVQEKILNTPNSELQSLINKKDVFEKSIPVYTWDFWRIQKRYCEEPGRPNICHDGTMMYENTYTEDIKHAKKECVSAAFYSVKTVFPTCIDAMKHLWKRLSLLIKKIMMLFVSLLYFVFYR